MRLSETRERTIDSSVCLYLSFYSNTAAILATTIVDCTHFAKFREKSCFQPKQKKQKINNKKWSSLRIGFDGKKTLVFRMPEQISIYQSHPMMI